MNITIKPFTLPLIPDVVDFERRLRIEENFWGWEIDEEYVKNIENSFTDKRFDNSVSLLAYVDGKVVGRIDASLITTRMDGSINAYLDWICVIKSFRHKGVAQALLGELRKELKSMGANTLIALTAENEESQSFYRSVKNAVMRDVGIWIEL